MLSGCSRQVSPVSAEMKELNQALGFNDKDQDGVIEKATFWTLWTDEGYTEAADIDKDGELVEAEIRFYLHTLQISSGTEEEKPALEKLKQENPLTEADKIELDELFQSAIEYVNEHAKKFKAKGFGFTAGEYKSEEFDDIASKMAKAGSFKRAIEVAKTIESPWDNYSKALSNISSEMAKVGLFKEALETAKTIKSSINKSEALINIAVEMVEAGSDKNEVYKIFQLAIGAANTIEYPEHKSDALNNIDSEMAKAGFSQEEINEAFGKPKVPPPTNIPENPYADWPSPGTEKKPPVDSTKKPPEKAPPEPTKKPPVNSTKKPPVEPTKKPPVVSKARAIFEKLVALQAAQKKAEEAAKTKKPTKKPLKEYIDE